VTAREKLFLLARLFFTGLIVLLNTFGVKCISHPTSRDIAALADANDSEFFDHLAPDDRAALLRILRGIVEKRGLHTVPVD
jgi:hypothetical protein